jgi:hypothetical protein
VSRKEQGQENEMKTVRDLMGEAAQKSAHPKFTVIITDRLGDRKYEGFEVDGRVYAIIAGEEKPVSMLEKWGFKVKVVR